MKSKSARQTQKMAADLLKKISKSNNYALVLALRGDLGGGKTTFVQGLARASGIKEKILSPTFNILKRYGNLYHFDCYRVEDSKEILDLGFEEIIKNPKNIVAIEWAEKIKEIIPKYAFWLTFDFIDKTKREINVLK
jgi:tRNA threonylcarbamoyladenosine biosynthesis protein TsaE